MGVSHPCHFLSKATVWSKTFPEPLRDTFSNSIINFLGKTNISYTQGMLTSTIVSSVPTLNVELNSSSQSDEWVPGAWSWADKRLHSGHPARKRRDELQNRLLAANGRVPYISRTKRISWGQCSGHLARGTIPPRRQIPSLHFRWGAQRALASSRFLRCAYKLSRCLAAHLLSPGGYYSEGDWICSSCAGVVSQDCRW